MMTDNEDNLLNAEGEKELAEFVVARVFELMQHVSDLVGAAMGPGTVDRLPELMDHGMFCMNQALTSMLEIRDEALQPQIADSAVEKFGKTKEELAEISLEQRRRINNFINIELKRHFDEKRERLEELKGIAKELDIDLAKVVDQHNKINEATNRINEAMNS